MSANCGVVVDRHPQGLPGGQRCAKRRSGAEQPLDGLWEDGQLAGGDLETDDTSGPSRSSATSSPAALVTTIVAEPTGS